MTEKSRMQRLVVPDLADIPHTRFDCDDHSYFMDCTGTYRICKILQPGILYVRDPVDCAEWCAADRCPKGFP